MTDYVRVHNIYDPDGTKDHVVTPDRARRITAACPDQWVTAPFDMHGTWIADPPPGFRGQPGLRGRVDPVDAWDSYMQLTDLREREQQYRAMMAAQAAGGSA